jgi:hypothetical protein
VADGIQQMVATNSLPSTDVVQGGAGKVSDEPGGPDRGGSGSHLRVVK